MVEHPERYRSLFVFHAGDWTGVGYTADEIAVLLEDPRYADGRVFRIQRADPSGRMELRGVARERFHVESGMFFYRSDPTAAREDYETLRARAADSPPPCRCFVHLVDRGVGLEAGAGGADERARHATVLIYPSEYDDDVAAWLLAAGYAGGDTVEGGISHVTNYYEQASRVLARTQLWSRQSFESRTSDEVLGTAGQSMQRRVAGA